jgi:hypothetical protein
VDGDAVAGGLQPQPLEHLSGGDQQPGVGVISGMSGYRVASPSQ